MTSLLIIKDTHPAKDFTSIIQSGLKALNLALTYKAEINLRLPGVAVALSNDLDAMSVVVPGALQARHEAVAATTAQNVLIKQGHALVKAIRQTVRKSGATADVRRAYGVGQKVPPNVLRHVKAALQQIVDRAAGNPQEAEAIGIIPADVEALKAFVEVLTDAAMTQEKKRASAPLSTKERNKTANRILQTVALIAGAGRIAFASDPTTYASFAALVASPKKSALSRQSKPKMSGEAPSPGESERQLGS